MSATRKNLSFFRLLDEQDRLSLTNITLFAALARFIVRADDFSVLALAVASALYVASAIAANYRARDEASATTVEHVKALQAVQVQVKALDQKLKDADNARAVKAVMR